MCSSCRRYRQGRASSRDATVLAMEMARASARRADARTRRNVNSDSDSPLSNFLPSGSISFTLKISSNSTPAMLLTLTALRPGVGWTQRRQVRTNGFPGPAASVLNLKNSIRSLRDVRSIAEDNSQRHSRGDLRKSVLVLYRKRFDRYTIILLQIHFSDEIINFTKVLPAMEVSFFKVLRDSKVISSANDIKKSHD